MTILETLAILAGVRSPVIKDPPCTERTLILIRGLPDSGKSTLARSILRGLSLNKGQGLPRMAHFEEDMFLKSKEVTTIVTMNDLTEDQKQAAVASQIHEAQTRCREMVAKAMADGVNIIVVSNNFVRLYELELYKEHAVTNKYTVQEIILDADFGQPDGPKALKKRRMRKNFQYRRIPYILVA